MSADVVRRRINFREPRACEGCGKVAPSGGILGGFHLYRYRPFRGSPLVCSRECDIRARPPLELGGTGGPR